MMKRYGVRGYNPEGLAVEQWFTTEADSNAEVEKLKARSDIKMVVTFDLHTWAMKRIVNNPLKASIKG